MPSIRAHYVTRILDIIFAATGLILGFPILLIIYLFGLFDTGSPLFRQTRVGKQQRPFTLIKFRTMRPDTESVASHLANQSAITPVGRYLRKSKLDELPQLWNVLTGDMSLVGPRPNLFNQHELIEERSQRGVYEVAPGITGLAQVNNIDMSTPEQLAKTDQKMIDNMSIKHYFRYILLTATGSGQGDAVDS